MGCYCGLSQLRGKLSDLCKFWMIYRTFFFILCTLPSSMGANIQTKEMILIRNPETLPATGGNKGPDYFGYDFAWKLVNDGNTRNVSFLIGAPKGGASLDDLFVTEVDNSSVDEEFPDKPGDMFSCDFSLQEGVSPCRSISPSADIPDDPALMTDGDSMGLKIMKSPTDDDVLSCAPLRARNCSSEFLPQGACFASKNYGNTWEVETKQTTTHCPVQLMDLMFVFDGSGSVTASDPRNFDMVKSWVKTVTGKFDLRGFAQVGVVQYSHWYKGRDDQPYLKTEIELGQFNDQKEFEMAVDRITIQGFTTYTAHAINKTVDDFMQSERFDDPATKKVMILLTDGRSVDVADLPVSAAYARSLDITIFAVGVAGFSEKELQIIANGEVGNNQRVYGLQRFSDLKQIVGSLQKSITGILEGSAFGNETNDLQTSETGLGGSIGRVCIYVSIARSDV